MLNRTICVGIEGNHRTGKTTTANKLSIELSNLGIACQVLRIGASIKPEQATNDKDKKWWTNWWQKRFSVNHNNLDIWHECNYKIAQQYLEILAETQQREGTHFIIQDRSVLSAAIPTYKEGVTNKEVFDCIYKESYLDKFNLGSLKVMIQDVVPDVIFLLMASFDDLYSRIEVSDDNYSFRVERIGARKDYWEKIILEVVPEYIKKRIVVIENPNSSSPDEVINKIITVLKTKNLL